MQTNNLTPLPFPVKYKERKRISFPAICAGCSIFWVSACTSPLSPTPQATPLVTVTLTVVARDSVTRAPLSAMRAYSGTSACVTAANGECTLPATPGEPLTVAIWGDGYPGALYTGTLLSAERWTFYLEGGR